MASKLQGCRQGTGRWHRMLSRQEWALNVWRDGVHFTLRYLGIEVAQFKTVTCTARIAHPRFSPGRAITLTRTLPSFNISAHMVALGAELTTGRAQLLAHRSDSGGKTGAMNPRASKKCVLLSRELLGYAERSLLVLVKNRVHH